MPEIVYLTGALEFVPRRVETVLDDDGGNFPVPPGFVGATVWLDVWLSPTWLLRGARAMPEHNPGWLPDDDLTRRWLGHVAEYRAACDADSPLLTATAAGGFGVPPARLAAQILTPGRRLLGQFREVSNA